MSAQPNHDPALTAQPNGAPAPPAGVHSLSGANGEALQLANLDSNQIMTLLRHLPGVFNKLAEQGNLKEDAAQTLSNLSQATFTNQHHPYQTQIVNDPGPSSHPRGPPNLGQLSAVASASAMQTPSRPGQEAEDGVSDGEESVGASPPKPEPSTSTASTSTRTRGRNPAMGSDEWTRQRKDNHKEVERRRRGNINEGINELGRIVPNGSGEKAKGAILSRAVQYIHHLKENEARNIEKWTLEKLLMDQAMGDMQAQLEDMRRAWEEERMARQRAESELELLRGVSGTNGSAGFGAARSKSPETGKRRESGESADPKTDSNRDGKRQRVE